MNRIYNNYVSGPVNQISNCLEVILYNKSSFTERISQYNLEDFYLKNLVKTSDKYVKIFRDSSSVNFEYKKQLEKGFNVIVYISNITNSPIGYSEFVNTQGDGVSLEISINITRTLKDERLNLEVRNQLVGKDLSKVYTGKELYQYATLSDISGRTFKNSFTSDIERIAHDSFSLIVGSSGIVTKESSWKIKINREIVIDASLGNYNVCFYNGDLMLACWEGKNYKLCSLIGNLGIISGSTTENIERIEGRYYFDTTGRLRHLDTGEEIQRKRGSLFCDYQDPHCMVYDLPTFYSKSEILKYIPEINNIYLDLDNYLKSNQAVIYSKIGSWFILAQDLGGEILYIAVSPTSIINMTKEDLNSAIFVGDQTVILRESGYYVVYNSPEKELYTERARAFIYNGRLDWWNIVNDPDDPTDDVKFKFCFLDTEEDELHFEEYYGSEGLVHLVYEYEDLWLTVLGKYRRNIYPQSNGIPELIGSYRGLIFYKTSENKVSYL